jgi:hypothetical protein
MPSLDWFSGWSLDNYGYPRHVRYSPPRPDTQPNETFNLSRRFAARRLTPGRYVA